MDACLSFTTVSIFTYTDTYTDHGHGSQFTDLWMASFNLFTFAFDFLKQNAAFVTFLIALDNIHGPTLPCTARS